MYKYRISIDFLNPKETLDYYIAAESDYVAKKFFLALMLSEMKKEQLLFDNIHFGGQGFEVIATYKEQTYLHGRLACLPKKYRNVKNIEHLKQEELLNGIRHICKKSNKSVLKNIWAD